MDAKPTGRFERANPVSDRRGSIRSWRSYQIVIDDIHWTCHWIEPEQSDNHKSIAKPDSSPAHINPFRGTTRQS